MKSLTTALVLLCALVLAGAAAATDFGANDDTGKFLGPDAGPYYTELAGVGLKVNVISVKWDPARPEEILDREQLDAVLPLAEAAGVKVVLALYPLQPTAFAGDGGTPEAFAVWAASVARAYPQVTEFVVGNEPNQPRFWQPQFDAAGRQVSAAAFGRVLAAAYDALKAVDPELTVVGVGLSPRGNDDPGAPNNVSTSPVRFLTALGRWYRHSGRTLPLMDAFSFHPYPRANTDALLRNYVWPNAGIANLGRIQLALWDAFHGTAQPTTANGLRLTLDEVGWQVDTTGATGYTGDENVPVTDEWRQALVYGQLVRMLVCQPAVVAVNLFGFVDDPKRSGFQAGLYRADGTPRPAVDAVRQALVDTGGACTGTLASWRVSRTVVGATAAFPRAARPLPSVRRGWRFEVGAGEEATFRAGIFPAGLPSRSLDRVLASAGVVRMARASTTGIVRPSHAPLVDFGRRALAPGRYVYAIRLAATANPQRTTTIVSRPFVVVSPR